MAATSATSCGSVVAISLRKRFAGTVGFHLQLLELLSPMEASLP